LRSHPTDSIESKASSTPRFVRKGNRLVWLLVPLLLLFPFILLIGEVVTWNIFFNPVPPPLSAVTPETFRFEDYGMIHNRSQQLLEALQKVIPIGTPEDEVDNVLVTHAGSHKGHKTKESDAMRRLLHHQTLSEEAVVGYRHKAAAPPINPGCSDEWTVSVVYDSSQRVKSVGLLPPMCWLVL
jgi:hypothetical protein